MMKLAKNIRLIFLYARINIQNALAYRAAFLMQAGSMFVSNATFIFFWWIAFSLMEGKIGGYDFKDVMFIWALTSTAGGVCSVFLGNSLHISETIYTGELDIYLLQPKPVLIGLMCSRSTLSGWGDLLYGFVLLAVSHGADARAWTAFLIMSFVGGLLISAALLLAHSLTFFFGDASSVGGSIIQFILNFSIYPMGIFPAFVRVIMHTLIPSAFIVHIPLSLVKSFDTGTLIFLAAGIAAYMAVAYAVFRIGLKRYESGNLIITRM